MAKSVLEEKAFEQSVHQHHSRLQLIFWVDSLAKIQVGINILYIFDLISECLQHMNDVFYRSKHMSTK